MNYVIFDLEWNGCFSKKLDSNINEIIEIGAVRLDQELNVTGKFNILVRPEISKRLNSSVKTLTSLTYEDLMRGAPFAYGYNKFRKFCNGCILMTWSTSDIDALVSNVRYYKKFDKIDFMKKYIDLQQYCHDMLGLSDHNALGLQAAVDFLGIDTEDIPHHRALGDSIMSAMCLQKLYHKGALNAYITDTTKDEFYDRLFFHPYHIEDINDKDIDHSKMFFNCGKCGARTDKISKWDAKCKCFTAKFCCPKCHYEFAGRMQFKKKYDSVIITKKILKPHNNAEHEENSSNKKAAH